MIDDLKPYPRYKDSGVPWLGTVPLHWETPRLKAVLREVDRRSTTGTEKLLSLRMQTGLVDHHALGGKLIPPANLIGYKRTEPGEIVMNRMRAAAGLFAATPTEGLVSPDYAVLRPKVPVSLDFLVHLFRTPLMMSIFRLESRGLGTGESGFLRLYTERFGMLAAPLPPLPEQLAIVRFLDHADRLIKKYIRAKQKLIKLLEEQKQAIIHRAVTRGFDPHVKLKPSGIEWLGEVPEGWEVKRAKQVCTAIVDCKNRTPDMVLGGEYTVVRTTNIRNGGFHLAGSYPTDRRHFEIWTQRGAPRQGDVFFTREAPAGEACLVPNIENLCMGQRMMYFRPDPELLDCKFMLHSIYGPIVRTYIQVECNGSTVGHLRLGQVSALPLLWCPIEEQRSIVAYIETTVAPLEAAMARAHRELSLLREYRTRLIADVVTGKLDVRAAAASLPDLLDEAEGAGQEESALDEADDGDVDGDEAVQDNE